ncbi:MAG TPA: histidine phosphatase family protein [Actinomycetes bacterium]|nr:histidine phosphatase family protein [Actinomycetes bacterium]
MRELVLLRHGETAWSRAGRHTGRTDVPLTERGREQAAAAGALLAGRAFALVLSSPLQRARETAGLAGYADPRLEPDAVEWDYGGYEGLTSEQIRAQVGHDWTIFSDGVVPGATPGESLAQVAARADRVLARALEARGDVLLFSHGHFLRVLAARWVGQPPGFAARLALGTAALSRLGYEHGTPAVLEWNRSAGLSPPGADAGATPRGG